MLEISFMQVFVLISISWILIRSLIVYKNKHIGWKREFILLNVYVCIVMISRIVYFPYHYVNGHIGVLRFDFNRIFPLQINIKPLTFVYERYIGWQRNIFGNIAMFIPVGICWPMCFKQLNRVKKVVVAGFWYSLMIEISQLFFYERYSDIDDLILNTIGVFIGAMIYFLIDRVVKNPKCKKSMVANIQDINGKITP